MEAPGDKLPLSAEALERVRNTTDAIYRAESRLIFATLVRLLGDFDVAEEALHDAFRAALEQWPSDGVPSEFTNQVQHSKLVQEVLRWDRSIRSWGWRSGACRGVQCFRDRLGGDRRAIRLAGANRAV